MRVLVFLSIAAAGCADDTKGPDPEPAISETRLGTEAGDIVLRLLDQGSEPRRVLRYDLRGWMGGTATMEIDVSIGMRAKEGEAPRSIDVPMRAAIDYSPVTETGDGDLRAEFSMWMERTEMKGWTVMTQSGHVKEVGFELPQGTQPAVEQAMDGMRRTLRQMATPFPREPIGKGARWEVVAPIDMMGLRFDARAAYRLDEPSEYGGKASVTMTIACSGDLDLPGDEQVKAKVESMRAEGSGTFAFDLRSLIPETALETSMSMKLVVGEEAVEQDMTMRMKLSRAE